MSYLGHVLEELVKESWNWLWMEKLKVEVCLKILEILPVYEMQGTEDHEAFTMKTNFMLRVFKTVFYTMIPLKCTLIGFSFFPAFFFIVWSRFVPKHTSIRTCASHFMNKIPHFDSDEFFLVYGNDRIPNYVIILLKSTLFHLCYSYYTLGH